SATANQEQHSLIAGSKGAAQNMHKALCIADSCSATETQLAYHRCNKSRIVEALRLGSICELQKSTARPTVLSIGELELLQKAGLPEIFRAVNQDRAPLV